MLASSASAGGSTARRLRWPARVHWRQIPCVHSAVATVIVGNSADNGRTSALASRLSSPAIRGVAEPPAAHRASDDATAV